MIAARPPCRSFAVLALAMALVACGGEKTKQAPPTPTVGVVTIREQPVAITTELQGRTNAFRASEVRPQVNGIVQARLFTEGSRVRQGQPLYRIDPAPYRAALAEAQATLQSAQANRVTAQLRTQRYQNLVAVNAVSRQDADDARATAGQANAAVGQAQAQVQAARINLRYTNVNAPISGRIGRSTYTVGALVTASQTEPLAVISQLDPIFVDIQQSATDLIQLRRQLTAGGAVSSSAPVRLKLEDGSDYGAEGRLEFGEVTVDSSTGAVALRARFPNPNGLLLPGMFVRAVIQQATRPNAILVPQTGVSRSARGDASVMLLGPDNKVINRPITTEGTSGASWVVTKGLKAGDRVIVEGLQNAHPGMVVKSVAASTLVGGGAPAGSANTARTLSDEEKKRLSSGKAKGPGGR